MKKLFTFIIYLLPFSLFGANGDTTKITTHNKVVIKTNPNVGVTNYKGWGVFPSPSTKIHKIYALLTFECAPGLNCGEWDYINSIFLTKKGGINGDSLGWEIARFITPYGNYWNSASKWKHTWLLDLTDFALVLRDSVQITYQHSGYEGNTDRGWQITLDINCIEGTPVREPVKIERLWWQNVPFGQIAKSFNEYVSPKSLTIDANANNARVKIVQTGHGFNTLENCAEFCSKKRNIIWDGNQVSSESVWRNDCGWNSLFPQAGTWVYDRAGWCPGATVRPFDFDMNVTGGTNHTIDVDMEDYINTGGSSANYVLSGYFIQYSTPSFTNDASVDDIVSPSANLEYNRYNPICTRPVIKLKNNGKVPLTSATIEYGVSGGPKTTYNWTGNIPAYQTEQIELANPMVWVNTSSIFEATIKSANGSVDEYPVNNLNNSKYTPTPMFPDKIYIYFRTNKAASENYYIIKDVNGNVIHRKDNFANETTYRDTLTLSNAICYIFEFYDDGTPPAGNPLNKDGLNWWGNPDDGTGSLAIRSVYSGGNLKSYSADFGTKILQQFSVGYRSDINSPINTQAKLFVYPNPSKGLIKIDMELPPFQTASTLSIFDVNGKKVYTESIKQKGDVSKVVDLNGKAAGIYFISIETGGAVLKKKVLIAP